MVDQEVDQKDHIAESEQFGQCNQIAAVFLFALNGRYSGLSVSGNIHRVSFSEILIVQK